jgi:hypothetical protein
MTSESIRFEEVFMNRTRGNSQSDAPARLKIAAAMVLVLVLATAFYSTEVWAQDDGPSIRVVKDASGSRLHVDGEEFMVFGMNWGYIPIGENYLYDLWAQPDDFIETVLAREMPLLTEMGVNVIRQYVGIPPRWIQYIYENYGIYTVINHTVGRYGFTLDGVWIPFVDYADPQMRAALKADVLSIVDEVQGTPGLLMYLLGNENNYGLSWTSFEIEALPEGEREAARARHLYSLFSEITDGIKSRDPDGLVAIANGDVQYIEIIAQECRGLDVFGTNVYRGISARDLFQVVEENLGIPVMFTEFGSDAFNAKEMREDQLMQARYLIGQWQEIYEQSSGKGRVGNAIGGIIFQWSDGWWKFGQDSRLDIHDTNASWPNGGYIEDYVEGENNMNEEWWGICAKGPPDFRGLFEVYPRAAYYALRRAFRLDPYAPETDLAVIREHFGAIHPKVAELEARSDRAARVAESLKRVHLADVRLELETISNGGKRISTPKAPARSSEYPSFRGFDHMQSFYVDFEANPAANVMGTLSLNILGNVPTNPIDEIFYENRGRRKSVQGTEGEEIELEGIQRVKVYQAGVSWDSRWFLLDGFYRTGHFHWGYEGDFFGLYQDAFYGENIDIYNGEAPVGFEITGKKDLNGLKVAFGPQLWWGANPSFVVKYSRRVGSFDATAIYHEDIAAQSSVTTSIAVPLPETRRATIHLATERGPVGIEVGGIWSGEPEVGRDFYVAEEEGDGYRILEDEVKPEDALGAKARVMVVSGRWHWYAQGAYMGVVADGGPTATNNFTGWHLKDSGLGNQSNIISGLAVNVGDFQVGPNVLWQKPIVGPIPAGVPSPGWPRNVLDDPFAVRSNREMFGAELLLAYDPTPATWMWAWDNDTREDAGFAASLGFIYRDFPTTQDASIYVESDGRTTTPFSGAPPPREHWEVHGRVVSAPRHDLRLIGHLYGGTAEGNGYDPSGENETLNRLIHRYGVDARVAWGSMAFETAARFNDWGPYDYHRDFNLTYPLQLSGDLSYNLGTPRWFGYPQTRLGVKATWRSLDEHSPRYCPMTLEDGTCVTDVDEPNGSEWEIRTYLHVAM